MCKIKHIWEGKAYIERYETYGIEDRTGACKSKHIGTKENILVYSQSNGFLLPLCFKFLLQSANVLQLRYLFYRKVFAIQ